MPDKKSIRAEIRVKLDGQSLAERAKRSGAIRNKLFGLEAFKKARCVCFFASLPTEVDTSSMIDEAIGMGKKVLVPLTDLENKELKLYEIKNRGTDLKPGTLGIPEPVVSRTRAARADEPDCVVVPGLCFDKDRNRLGRGAGFYDRFLKNLKAGVPKIGLGFSFQVVQKVPAEPHDVTLDWVLTD